MKLTAVAILKWNGESEPLLFGLAADLSTFGFFQRGSVKEMLTFVSRTVAKRTQPGTRQTVQHEEYYCHAHNRDGLVSLQTACFLCSLFVECEPLGTEAAFAEEGHKHLGACTGGSSVCGQRLPLSRSVQRRRQGAGRLLRSQPQCLARGSGGQQRCARGARRRSSKVPGAVQT